MLNFGQLRERFESMVGQSVPAGTLASWIDEAQEEISGEYGKRIRLWYPQPINYLSGDITASDVVIPTEDGLSLPSAPDYVNIGLGDSQETVKYGDILGDSMTDVTRGEYGTTPKVWLTGTPISLLPLAGVEHDLPEDLYLLHEVRDVENYPVFAYQVDSEMKITFFNDGVFRIIYTPVPDRIDPDDNASIPVVHQMFHSSILTYCLAKHWQKIAEGIPGEEQKALTLMREFESRVDRIGRRLRRNENQNYEIGFELW